MGANHSRGRRSQSQDPHRRGRDGRRSQSCVNRASSCFRQADPDSPRHQQLLPEATGPILPRGYSTSFGSNQSQRVTSSSFPQFPSQKSRSRSTGSRPPVPMLPLQLSNGVPSPLNLESMPLDSFRDESAQTSPSVQDMPLGSFTGSDIQQQAPQHLHPSTCATSSSGSFPVSTKGKATDRSLNVYSSGVEASSERARPMDLQRGQRHVATPCRNEASRTNAVSAIATGKPHQKSASSSFSHSSASASASFCLDGHNPEIHNDSGDCNSGSQSGSRHSSIDPSEQSTATMTGAAVTEVVAVSAASPLPQSACRGIAAEQCSQLSEEDRTSNHSQSSSQFRSAVSRVSETAVTATSQTLFDLPLVTPVRTPSPRRKSAVGRMATSDRERRAIPTHRENRRKSTPGRFLETTPESLSGPLRSTLCFRAKHIAEPPTTKYWEHPLTRVDKEARVLLLDMRLDAGGASGSDSDSDAGGSQAEVLKAQGESPQSRMGSETSDLALPLPVSPLETKACSSKGSPAPSLGSSALIVTPRTPGLLQTPPIQGSSSLEERQVRSCPTRRRSFLPGLLNSPELSGPIRCTMVMKATGLPVPPMPESQSWEWPLTREEKKTRVMMMDVMMAEDEQEDEEEDDDVDDEDELEDGEPADEEHEEESELDNEEGQPGCAAGRHEDVRELQHKCEEGANSTTGGPIATASVLHIKVEQ